MNKYKRSAVAGLIIVFVVTSAGFASARRHHNARGNKNININNRGGPKNVNVRRGPRNVNVNVHNDRYYRHGRHPVARVGMGVAVGIVIGTAIATLPPRHNTVVVQNITYIVSDGIYYQVVPNGGYVVVAAPPGY